MLKIRIVCQHCNQVTYFTPGITNNLFEDLFCANDECKACLCSLMNVPDEEKPTKMKPI